MEDEGFSKDFTVFENCSKILNLTSEASYVNFLNKTLANVILPLENSSLFSNFTVEKESARIYKNFHGA